VATPLDSAVALDQPGYLAFRRLLGEIERFDCMGPRQVQISRAATFRESRLGSRLFHTPGCLVVGREDTGIYATYGPTINNIMGSGTWLMEARRPKGASGGLRAWMCLGRDESGGLEV
jgi:hypothetical protein